MRKILLLLIITIFLSGCTESTKLSEVDSDVSFSENDCKTNKTHSISDVIESNDIDENRLICSDYNWSEHGEVYNFLDTLNILCEEGEQYKIYSNTDFTSYYYEIYDKYNNVIDNGYYGFCGGEFDQDGNILKMRLHYGGNIGSERFYDTDNGRISKWFSMTLDNSNELIAYFAKSRDNSEQTAIIITNMFDSTVYYHEFPREISTSSLLQSYIVDAEFLENDTKFKITYTDINDEEVTEIIELP